ncbi:hypothetical protein DFP72DRAFT_858753 [Ephemerocybe angulata]|uniref:Uncharacterized protein n=1 Tax=Ephemerocybe angulata TaxID=980116 RepID=A0A8H6HAP0_9AGAR|nr:hypothetical protein DFP72DRAFT_858753 [Tulosesus angulatus]
MALLLPEADKVALAATSGAFNRLGGTSSTTTTFNYTYVTESANLDSAETVLLKWLGGPDYISIRRSVLERRMEGTVTWFLELKEFKQLVDDTGVILMGNWVAMPGTRARKMSMGKGLMPIDMG